MKQFKQTIKASDLTNNDWKFSVYDSGISSFTYKTLAKLKNSSFTGLYLFKTKFDTGIDDYNTESFSMLNGLCHGKNIDVCDIEWTLFGRDNYTISYFYIGNLDIEAQLLKLAKPSLIQRIISRIKKWF